MKRSAKYWGMSGWAMMAAVLTFGTTPVTAQATDTLQEQILRQVAAGQDATQLIKQYRAGQPARTASVRQDRSAEIVQLRSAEQALLEALRSLQGKATVSAEALAQAAAAYQSWQAAVLIFDSRQQSVAVKLQDSDAGSTYLARHAAMREAQDARRLQIRQLLDAYLGADAASAATSSTRTSLGASATAAALLLAQPPAPASSAPVLHAANLPVGALNLATRAPALTPLVVPSYATATEIAIVAADTAAAQEAPLSDEIVAQAKALGNDYVRIYEFVRNKHRTEWYAGSLKGAPGVLRSGAGNDQDQASLLVALLRAAGVPARYVHGVIELSVEQVANSLGLKDSSLAPSALTKAGVAFTPVAHGGKVAVLKIEHHWVSAFVPYTNYRGAVVDASGKSWIPLDPSFKSSSWGASTLALVDIGTAASVQADYLAQGRSVSLGDFIQQRGTELLQQRSGAAVDYAAQLGKQEITALNLSVLPNSLPYTVLAVTSEDAVLPDSLLVQAHVTLSSAGVGVLDATVPLSDIVNQRFTLSYQPASIEDHRLTLSFGGLDAVPLYLIKLRPQLSVGGKVRALGSDGVEPGSDLVLDIVVSGPFGSQHVSQTVMAGAYQALAVSGSAATRPKADDPADSESQAARLLDGVALAYNRNWIAGEAQLAALTGSTVLRPVPALAIVSNLMKTELVDGVPYTLAWQGVTLDAVLHPVEAVGAGAADFMVLSGLHGSSLEAMLFRDQFSVDAISADQGLALAKAQGLGLLSLDSSNLVALAATDHAAAVKAHITNLVRLGYKVDTPSGRLVNNAWTGSVWRARDSASGASGYFISGSLAGGATTTAPDAWPLAFLADALASANSDPYDSDSTAGVQVLKIGAGDGQTGTAGSELERVMSVVVLNKDGLPVLGAKVHFQVTAGGGKISGANSIDLTTNALGIASVSPTLGESTASNAVYVQLKAADLALTQVSMNLVDVTAESSRGVLQTDSPFSAIATPDKLAALRRSTPEVTSGPAAAWVDSLGIVAQDKFGNPIPNVEITYAIATEQVCPSSGAPAYFRQGAVFDNMTGVSSGAQACQVSAPQLGDCGKASFTAKSTTLGLVSGAVLLGNDLMGKNVVTVSGGGFKEDFVYTASGSCSMTEDNYTAEFYAIMQGQGQTTDGKGNNVSAAKPGKQYKRPVTATLFRTVRPYEMRVRNGKLALYFFPFVTTTKTDGVVEFSVSNAGSASEAEHTAAGDYTSNITVGGSPGANEVTGTATGVLVNVPVAADGVLKLEPHLLEVSGRIATVYAVQPKIDQLVAGDSSFIALDANARSVNQLELKYLIAPAAYTAALAEIDLYEDGNWMATVTGDKAKAGGTALVARGQTFDLQKDYQAELILNRGSDVELRSDKFTLPKQQKLISYATASKASLDVDLLNKRSCEIPGSITFGFTQDVVAKLVLQPVDADGNANGSARELFAGKQYAKGDFDYQLAAGAIGAGYFRFVLSVSNVNDASQTEEARGPVLVTYRQSNQLPVGQVIVNGVKVKDGSLVAQSQAMQLPGRGPALRFQPTYSSAANGEISTLGGDWTHNFDSGVRVNSCGEVVVSGGDAGSVRFFPNSDGTLTPDAGYHGTMLKNSSDSSFDFYSKDGTHYHYKFVDSSVQWQLDTIEDTNGNTLTLSYDAATKPAPRLMSVKSADGRAFNFAYLEKQVTSPVGASAKPFLQQVTGPDLAMTFQYDTFGNLISVDRNGRKETFTYNTADANYRARALLTSYTDPNGNVTSYEYNQLEISVTPDGSGTLIVLPHSMVKAVNTPSGKVAYDFEVPGFKNSKVTDQNGHSTSYVLNDYGNPLSITDGAGTTSMSWDTKDVAMLSKRDARGIDTGYGYDSAGNLVTETTAGKTVSSTWLLQTVAPYSKNRQTSHTDRNGNISAFAYDGKGNLLTETLPEGVIVRHSYAGNGDRFSTTDGNGGMTRFGYDAAGNLASTTTPLGFTSSMTRNTRGLVIGSTDARGNVTSFERDVQDQVTARTDPDGSITSYGFDAVGNTISQTDAADHKTVTEFNAQNLPVQITRADGSIKTTGYDGVGNKTSETDYRGNTTLYAYDDANRLVKRTEPLDKVTAYTYDGVGNVLTETDALNRVTQHEYDELGNRYLTTDAAGGKWPMRYDGNGNKIGSDDALGRSTTFTYDGLNRLTAVLRPLGAASSTTYDKNGNKLTETDPNGNVTRSVYDADDRLLQLFDAYSKQTVHEYDASDNLTKVVDPDLNVTLYSYDAMNRKRDMKDGEGYVTAYRYDELGNLLVETEPNGNIVTHGYDKLSRLTSTSDSLGLVGAWDYDADGNKTLETDGNGHSTLHSYNALNQLTGSTMPEGRTLAYGNDLAGNRTSFTDGRQHVTRYQFDQLNRLVLTTDALGGLHRIGYDAVGNKLAETDARGNQTVTAYDALNRPVEITDALQQKMTMGYDLVGNKTGETDKRGTASQMVYDKLNRLLTVTKDGVLLSSNKYDDAGNLLSVTDARGNATGYDYDKRKLRKAENHLLASITRFQLDAMGDVQTSTDPEGRVTTNTYDLRRQLTAQSNGAGETTRHSYDLAGKRLSTQRPLGNGSVFAYDDANRVIKITDAVGSAQYGYDNADNRVSFQDALGNVTTLNYDELNRRSGVSYPGGATESFSYDASGNLTSHTDGNGLVIGHTYDALNRETSKAYSASADGVTGVVTAYDANNNVVKVTQNGATTQISTFGYDHFDRQQEHSDSFGARVSTGYDANGNKSSLTTQDGKVTRYSYDVLNRVSTIVAQSGSTTYSYDRSGLNTRIAYGNGVTSDMSYDLAERVKTVVHAKCATNVSRTEYAYDLNGNRSRESIARKAGAQATTYGYDSVDRLTQTTVVEADKTVTTVYALDAVSNRSKETVTTAPSSGAASSVIKTYTYDGRNQLTGITDSLAGNTVLAYDQQGNLTSKTLGNDQTYYRYNARDNLISVTRNSTLLGSYSNDYLGLRIEKEAKDPLQPGAPPVRLRTLWDGRNAFQDSSTDGVVVSRYESDGRHPVSMWSTDGSQALHHDALGSIVATTDAAGAIKSETIYDAYGNVQERTGSSANKFGYTGHQMDQETGLIYFQARYYDPSIGRFITQDPFEGDVDTPASLHHYLYAYANPTVYVDLTGYYARDAGDVQSRMDADSLCAKSGDCKRKEELKQASQARDRKLTQCASTDTCRAGVDEANRGIDSLQARQKEIMEMQKAGLTVDPVSGRNLMAEYTALEAAQGGSTSATISIGYAKSIRNAMREGKELTLDELAYRARALAIAASIFQPFITAERYGAAGVGAKRPPVVRKSVPPERHASVGDEPLAGNGNIDHPVGSNGTKPYSTSSGQEPLRVDASHLRVRHRIAKIQENMSEGEQARTTYGVAEVELADGTMTTWVAGAGKEGYVPPRIRGNDMEVIKNKVSDGNSENRFNDAEQTLMREATNRGVKIISMGATRPMCAQCQLRADSTGLGSAVATPRK
jgi:RHS repeat-associated protein